MHIQEAINLYPQLEDILKKDFSKEVWDDLMSYGKHSRFLPEVPFVDVLLGGVDMGKPIKITKRIQRTSLLQKEVITYTIKNK
jgi:hypothetical protein